MSYLKQKIKELCPEAKAILKKVEKEGNYKVFTYKKYKCEIIRPYYYYYEIKELVGSFHLCGYVQIPEEYKLYKKNVDFFDELIEVHGGITFYEKIEEKENKYLKIGFDCGHAFDLSMIYILNIQMQCEDENAYSYKDMKFVEEQLKSMINQLIKLEKKL